nr:YkgJ family cysteine cluster protein [Candidatus Sigynarchaeota archaeon]
MVSVQDIKAIKTIAKRKEKENYDFYAFLKGIDMPEAEIDAMVHDLYHKYAGEVDCKTCRNCCKVSSPVLSEEDVARLAKIKGLSTFQLKHEWLKANPDEPHTFLVNNLPCPFLEAGECAFGKNKPEGCGDYPYLLKEKFTYHLHTVLDNYDKCPIVFNVVEMLKHLVWNR